MSRRERVTIVIPSFNRMPLICRAIDSVLAQSHAPTRCLVVDDASTDDTAALLRQRYEDRVDVLVNPVNRGQSHSRNRGVRECEADFVGFLDSDDILTPRSVEERLALFLEDPGFDGVVFGRRAGRLPRRRAGGADPEARGAHLQLDDYLQDVRWLTPNAVLARRDFWLRTGGFDEALRNHEDTEFFLRLLTRAEFRNCAAVVTEVLPDAPNRDRENWDRIAVDWNLLSTTLEKQGEVVAALGPDRMAHIRRKEHGDRMRAHYRSGRGAAYRQAYREARALGLKPRGLAFEKRYLLSYFLRRPRAD